MSSEAFRLLCQRQPRYFLGANSGEGFCNYFEEIYRPLRGDRLYILKGGPGTGKSTLMKRLALAMDALGQPCELCFCSSDPRSLDGVSFPTARAAIVDGTAPHVMEAKYLGVSERIINVGDCLDYAALERQSQEILPLYAQNAKLHKRAARFLTAAAQLLDDSFAADCECSDLEKAEELALRLCKTWLPPTGEKGEETKRFLSGVTPDGPMVLEDTLTKLADHIILIEDEYGAASSVILSAIRQYALQAGYKIIVCPCALSPGRKTDHIIVPSRKLAFCTSNCMLPIAAETKQRIHARRFRDTARMAERKQRLRFNRRAAEELIDGAGTYLREARQIHDLLESYYVQAMDFERCAALQDAIFNELKDRI